MDRTLILLKPDAVMRRLIGGIVGRFEAKGLKVVGMKLIRVSQATAEAHYAVHRGKGFYPSLITFITGGPVVAMVLEGERAVDVCRKMLGKTFGFEAEAGTIRGDLGISNQFNLVHASDSQESAAKEIPLFFKEAEIVTYTLPDEAWIAGA